MMLGATYASALAHFVFFEFVIGLSQIYESHQYRAEEVMQ